MLNAKSLSFVCGDTARGIKPRDAAHRWSLHAGFQQAKKTSGAVVSRAIQSNCSRERELIVRNQSVHSFESSEGEEGGETRAMEVVELSNVFGKRKEERFFGNRLVVRAIWQEREESQRIISSIYAGGIERELGTGETKAGVCIRREGIL